MPLRPDCIRHPKVLRDRNYRPDGARIYKVKSGDTWATCASRLQNDLLMSFGAWELIRFNFPDLPHSEPQAALELNWYLQHYVGCHHVTADGRNLKFSSDDKPGLIYLPAAGLPMLYDLKERRTSILANTPGLMRVADNPSARANPNPYYSIERLEEVRQNSWKIEACAKTYSLDVDFVKAIVWLESTHGWYDRLQGDKNETIRPLNVHARLWADLGITRPDLLNTPRNIEIGVYILYQIWSRTEKPTCEKVATLYNKLGATEVSIYGKTVEYYRLTKPWMKPLPAPPKAYQHPNPL